MKKKVFMVVFLGVIFSFSNVFAGGYAESSVSLQTFKSRYNEIKNDDSINYTAWGKYAASSVSLQTFKNRYNEIKNDDSINYTAW